MDMKKIKNDIKGAILPAIISILLFFSNKELFGISNALIAPYMTLTFIKMRKNIFIESNTLRNYIIHLSIGVLASIACQNIFTSVTLNFIIVLVITYILTEEYDSASYFTFLLGFVLLQLIPITLEQIPERLLAITYSYLVVRLFLRIFAKDRVKKQIYSLMNEGFLILSKEIEIVLNNDKKEWFEEEEKLLNTCRELNRIICESYEKEYLEVIIVFQQFNNLNKELLSKQYIVNRNREYIKNIYNLLKDMPEIKSSCTVLNYIKKLKDFMDSNYFKDEELKEYISFILKYIISSADVMKSIEEKKKYKLLNLKDGKSNITKLINEDLSISSYRVRFSLRLSMLLSIGFGIDRYLNDPKVYWIPLTIYVMVFPYYEESKERIKQRFIGTIQGLILAFFLFSIFRTEASHIGILIIATVLMYSFTNYATMNIYITCYALAITSLTMNPDLAILLRLLYTTISVIVVFIGNKFVFPNKSNVEVKKVMKKILEINKKLVELFKSTKNSEEEEEMFFNYIINYYLLNNKLNKLIDKSSKFKKEFIQRFLIFDNEFVTEIVYIYILSSGWNSKEKLIDEKKNKIEEIINNIDNCIISIDEKKRETKSCLNKITLVKSEINKDHSQRYLEISEHVNGGVYKSLEILNLINMIE